MKSREFNKYLNGCSKKGALDLGKLATLPEETKTGMALFIIRNRGPVLQELITPQIDQSWLASCGYLYKTVGKKTGYTFVHTCEHRII